MESIGDNAFSLTATSSWSYMCRYPEPLQCRLRNVLINASSVPENCLLASKLTDICFHPDNKFYKIYKDIMIIGKSSIESDDYDVLVYVIRNVETITIPNFIRIIGSFAFNNCKKLQKVEFTTDSKLEIIKDNSFSFLMIKDFTVPKTLTQIGQYAFEQCKKLEIFEIPVDSKLQTIDSFAFSNTPLKSLKFPSSLIELKDNWASELYDLKQINISSDNPKYMSIDDKTIIGKSSIENKEYDVFVFSIRNVVEIPNFIKSIFSNAFKDLVKIEIPNDSKLQVIENNAFAKTRIDFIYIPQTVKKIGKCAFLKCEYLLYIDISSNRQIKTIEEGTFLQTRIRMFKLPPQITKIGKNAFYFCSKLEIFEIDKQSELQIIEESAFQLSSIQEFTVPPHVTIIEQHAFERCYKLKEFNIPEDSELKTIGESAFKGTLIESISIPKNLVDLKYGWCNEVKIKQINVNLKNPMYKSIDDKMIIGKSSIENDEYDVLVFGIRNITTVTIPNFIKSIGPFSFDNCTDLRIVEIPNDSKLQTIEDCSFSGTSIEHTRIPSNVTKIGQSAFYKSNKLRFVEIPNDSKIQKISRSSFNGTSIETIKIPSCVTKIGNHAFSECKKLRRVEIPNDSNIEKIGENAFFKSSIQCFIIPSKVTKIQKDAFSFCNELQILEFDEELQIDFIDFRMFKQCKKLIIMIPSKLKDSVYSSKNSLVNNFE